MDPLAFMADKFKALSQRTHDFFDGLVHRRRESSTVSRSPIEILKRLQREAFSDLMKPRGRQNKVDRILSLYKTVKGGNFQEVGTVLRGEVDFLGGLFLCHNCDAISRAGFNTGLSSRFSVETTVRDNDALVFEFVSSQKQNNDPFEGFGGSLSLAKVLYTANAGDWLSAFVIPMGGKFSDVAICPNPSYQGKGLSDISSSGPSLLSQQSGSAIGVMVKKSNVLASLAQFVSELGMHPDSNRCLGTFGQVMCHLPRKTKLSVLGLLQVPTLSCQQVNRRPFTLSLGGCRHQETPEQTVDEFVPPMGTRSPGNASTGSIALMLESEVDEFTKIGGWLEVKDSDPKYLKWAVSMSDESEGSFGWGTKLSGTSEGPTKFDQFKVESYMKLNLGKKFSVKPGVAYIKDGNTGMTALMLQSNWSL